MLIKYLQTSQQVFTFISFHAWEQAQDGPERGGKTASIVQIEHLSSEHSPPNATRVELPTRMGCDNSKEKGKHGKNGQAVGKSVLGTQTPSAPLDVLETQRVDQRVQPSTSAPDHFSSPTPSLPVGVPSSKER